MRAAALVLALFGLNACSSAVAPAAAGGTTTVRVVSSSGAATVAGALAFAAYLDAASDPSMDIRPPPSFSGPSGAFWARPVPELDSGRKISEQDCTKPLDFSQGNIRCK